MPTRKLLREKIQTVYRTQDRCAYNIGISNGTLSRIINCTADPTDKQMEVLCRFLALTAKEVNKKDA